MPAGPRIRANFAYGTTTDNPLTAGATSFNSAELPTLPVVSSAHAVVTLDPRRVFGEPEIVVVTTHTAAATVATITRGQYGTVARSHPQGTEWVHSPIDEDFIEVLTSGTRPSNPYEGQFIFETDTNKLVGYGGVDWAPRDAGGQIAYAQVTAGNSGAGVILVATVGATVGTGRRIKVTGQIRQHTHSVVNGRTTLIVREDGVDRNAVLIIGHPTVAGNATMGGNVMWIGSTTAGAHTYSIHMSPQDAGTISFFADASNPAYVLVEDIGAA